MHQRNRQPYFCSLNWLVVFNKFELNALEVLIVFVVFTICMILKGILFSNAFMLSNPLPKRIRQDFAHSVSD